MSYLIFFYLNAIIIQRSQISLGEIILFTACLCSFSAVLISLLFLPNLKVTDFITDMGAAYKAADLVISRAGASSISEFCLIGKPVILVPSPNVAEDHQTKNALALADRDAAIYVKDSEAPDMLLKLAIDTVNNEEKLKSLSENVLKLALPDSANIIAKEVIKLAK